MEALQTLAGGQSEPSPALRKHPTPRSMRGLIGVLGAATLAYLLVPSVADAVRWDFLPVTTSFDVQYFSACGITVSSGVPLASATGVGLGGSGDLLINGNESLEVRFEMPVRGVRYFIDAATNTNGNMTRGDSVVEAYSDKTDPGSLLGSRLVSGTGLKDLELLFDGVPIERYTVAASGDGVRFGWFEYDAPSRVPIRMATDVAGGVDDLMDFCGVKFSGSATVRFKQGMGGGIGIVGGLLDHAVDGAETLLVQLPGAVTDVRISTHVGVTFFEGFDAHGVSLGVQATGGGLVELNDLFGDVPLSAFQLSSDGGPRGLQFLSYVPKPPANLLANPAFDFANMVDGWVGEPLASQFAWDPNDRNVEAGSGSVRITGNGGISSCVPVVEGKVYDFGANVFLPSGSAPTYSATVYVQWWDGPCEGAALAASAGTVTVTTGGTWIDVFDTTLPAPVGATWAALQFSTSGGAVGNSALFDDAILAPEPDGAMLFAAVAATLEVLRVSRRRRTEKRS